MSAPTPRRGFYGIDAPGVVVGFSLGVVAAYTIAIVFHMRSWFASGTFALIFLLLFLHTTLRGKFGVWHDLLDALALRGDEQVLDLGCGRGAVLLMAAGRLTTGRATGIDIWKRVDQSGNAQQATEANARAEGVADRIVLRTADMTSLPFEANTFDVIVSNVAIHNIQSVDGRRAAIDEAYRVLKPGGRLRITDISRGAEYRDRLVALGAAHVTMRGVGWRMWWGGPWVGTKLISASKPGAY